jgi:hypothetical protein
MAITWSASVACRTPRKKPTASRDSKDSNAGLRTPF